MKILRILLPLLLLFLLAPLAAEAQKPIPGIQQTAQWESMKNYVAFLDSRQNTPATSAQKTTYTNTLASRQLATNNRVKQLYSQAVNRIRNRDQRAERKQIGKIRASEKSQLNKIKSKRAAKLASEKSRFQSSALALRLRFDNEEASSRSQLKKLRRNLRQTNNPFRREVILARISTVQENLQTIGQQEKLQMQKLKRSHKEKVSSIRSRFALQATRSRAYYQSLVESVQNAWKKIYRDDLRAAQANRQRQFQLVSGLRAQGNQYIANMPLVS